MTMSWIATFGAALIFATVLLDARSGHTGFGSHRLSKRRDPERYWVVLVLYVNMAFGLVWLSGKAEQQAMECDPAADICIAASEQVA